MGLGAKHPSWKATACVAPATPWSMQPGQLTEGISPGWTWGAPQLQRPGCLGLKSPHNPSCPTEELLTYFSPHPIPYSRSSAAKRPPATEGDLCRDLDLKSTRSFMTKRVRHLDGALFPEQLLTPGREILAAQTVIMMDKCGIFKHLHDPNISVAPQEGQSRSQPASDQGVLPP